MKRIFTVIMALVVASVALAAESVIVPRPLSYEAKDGEFILSSKSVICVAEKGLVRPATMFCADVAREKSLDIAVVESAPKAKSVISLAVDKSLAEEEYLLDIAKQAVTIKGGSEKAVYYALQSLRQVVFHAEQKGKSVRVECATVKDKPHFGYRGAMLDVCRHFFTVEEVKQFIDILAMHKINKFHWHLTEDQGWRIEIKKYPNLTKVGSMRKETVVGLNAKDNNKFDGKPYGGYYTQEQVKDIVRYASERYIEVIPEIDMPGHMVAALASYPELGCTGGPYEVRTRWGISTEVLCAGKESTFEFVEGVLSELIELFPSKYIHIGGDECPKQSWKACPLCQQRIEKEGLKNEYELQSYFMHRVEKFLAKHGRSIIGWDEILDGGISKSATIMAWRGANRGMKAARLGNNVIMTPRHYCYLDYCQTSDSKANNEALCAGGNGRRRLPLLVVYSFDPYSELRENDRKAILGVQGNVWTEYMPNFSHVQHMVLPRLAAIAETGWSYGNKNYESFCYRLRKLQGLYDKNGYIYAPYFFKGIE